MECHKPRWQVLNPSWFSKLLVISQQSVEADRILQLISLILGWIRPFLGVCVSLHWLLEELIRQ